MSFLFKMILFMEAQKKKISSIKQILPLNKKILTMIHIACRKVAIQECRVWDINDNTSELTREGKTMT